VDRASLNGEFAEWMAASMRDALRDGYWGWFDDDMAFIKPWGFDLDSLRVPVHVWQGAHDRMVPFAHGEWLAAHIPTARPHLLPEHGHLTLAVDSLPWILDELLADR
jgi:pimeloyl-ACP methyl ester carboxylesterase